MKKMLLCSGFLLAALTIMPAEAQNKTFLRGDIPFEFSVGSYALPAGSYSIELKQDVIVLTNTQSGKAVAATLLPAETLRGGAGPSIEFHKYGNRAFLSAIRTADGSHGLPPSKTEREMSRGAKPGSVHIGLAKR